MISGDKDVGQSVENGPATIGQDGVIQQGKPSGPPHEGSRETYEGRIISVPRDYCWTPCGSGKILIGYKIWAWQREATNLANSVTQTSLRSHVKGSIITRCYGDDAGKLGGFISGTHNSWCTPKTWSKTVTFEGRNAVRDSDEWWMNRFNTWGILDYKKNTDQYSTPDTSEIKARMFLAQYTTAARAAAGVAAAGVAAAAPLAGRAATAVESAGSDILNKYGELVLKNTVLMIQLTARLQQTLSNILRTTNNNPCPVLEARIAAHIADLQARRGELLNDSALHDLFNADHDIGRPPYGSWNGHTARYNTAVAGLQNAVLMAKAAGCRVPPIAYIYLTLPTPSAPR